VLEVQRWRESSRFDEIDRAILSIAERSTLEPWNSAPADLERLRDLGYTDLQILNVVLLCAYRHYATRIADGTGIELDEILQTDDSIVAAYSYPESKAPADAEDGTETEGGTRDRVESDKSPPGPWIATLPDTELPESTRQIYARWRDRFGFVPGFIESLSLNPEALAAIDAQIDTVLFREDELTSRRRQLLAKTVASATHNRYLSQAFAEVAEASGEEERQLARFAEKLTIAPSRTTASDVDSLRQLGCSDTEALDIIVAVAALNSLVRLVAGLGVGPDPAWQDRDAGRTSG